MEEIYLIGHQFMESDTIVAACSSWDKAEAYIKAEYPQYVYDDVLASWYFEPDGIDNFIYIRRVQFIE